MSLAFALPPFWPWSWPCRRSSAPPTSTLTCRPTPSSISPSTSGRSSIRPLVKKSALPAVARRRSPTPRRSTTSSRSWGSIPSRISTGIIVASPSSGDSDRGLIIVQGTFDVKKFQAKAADAARNNDDVLKIHKVPLGGGVTHEVYQVDVPGQDRDARTSPWPTTRPCSPRGQGLRRRRAQAGSPEEEAGAEEQGVSVLVENMDARQSLTLAVLGKTLARACRTWTSCPEGCATPWRTSRRSAAD